MESSQQGARVLLYVSVVLGYQLQQQSQLFILHGLNQEAVILRQEEGTARFARRRQQAQRGVTSQRQQVVHVVDAEQLPETLEDQGAVVFPLEAAAVVAAQVLTDLCMGMVGLLHGKLQHGVFAVLQYECCTWRMAHDNRGNSWTLNGWHKTLCCAMLC